MKRTISILLTALLLLFALPTFAEGSELQAGLYVSENSSDVLYLDAKGVGVLNYTFDGRYVSNGVVWTETSLEIERVKTPFTVVNGALFFIYDDAVRTFRYSGAGEDYALGDREDAAYAGTYAAISGQKLFLTAEGEGVYQDAAGETTIYWGSLAPYWHSTNGSCFLLFDSYLCGMAFSDDSVVLSTVTEGDITLYLEEKAFQEPVEGEPYRITVASSAFDLILTLPADRWRVRETEAGLLIARDDGMTQYTFLSLPIEGEPDADILDRMGDHLWTACLTIGSVGFDGEDAIRNEYRVNGIVGRSLTLAWTGDDGAAWKGASVLWYQSGRLYAALCVAGADAYMDAWTGLRRILNTFRTAEEVTLEQPDLLLVDREAFDGIRELAPTPVVVEEVVYYGYRITINGQTTDIIPFLTAMGMDPRTICLILRTDGTGTIQYDEGQEPFTWDDACFTAEDSSIPYTREGDHIVLSMADGSIEFAPAAEVEPLFTVEDAEEKETVLPTVDALAGSWTFTHARAMDIEVPASIMGTSMSLLLNEDGTAVMLTDGSGDECRWSLREDGKVTLIAEDQEVFVLSFDGVALLLETGVDDVVMVFEKDA